MSVSDECPERATVETPRGAMETAPVVECRTTASAETGAVGYVTVEIESHRLEYREDDVVLHDSESTTEPSPPVDPR